jgi:hypothetical protein
VEQKMNEKDTQVIPEVDEKISKDEIRRGAEVIMLLLKWEQEMKEKKFALTEDICMS